MSLTEFLYYVSPTLMGLIATIWGFFSLVGEMPAPEPLAVLVVGVMLFLVGIDWFEYMAGSKSGAKEESQ